MKYALLLFIIFLSNSVTAQIVDFDDADFKTYILSLGFDSDGDGEIQLSEAEIITELVVNGSGASSLGGIKSFVNINDLTVIDIFFEMDLVGMTKLENLNIDIEIDGIISNINVSDCSSLANISLFGDDSVIGELLMNNCPSLTEVFILGSVIKLDFSDLPNLETIDFLGQSDSLTFGELPSLRTLTLNVGYFGEEFIINEMPELFAITIGVFDLDNFIVSNCPKLQFIQTGAPIEKISVLNCPSFIDIEAFGVSSMVIKECNSFKKFTYLEEGLDSLDLSGLEGLEELYVLGLNDYLNINGCYNLKTVELDGVNSLPVLDFSSCYQLEDLEISGTSIIQSLILQNGAMESLYFDVLEEIEYLCLDQEEEQVFVTALLNAGIVIDNVTTSCEFASGGRAFLVKGQSILDVNNDACATSDVFLPYSKYKITDSLDTESYFFAKEDGSYIYGVGEGDYTFSPDVLYGDDLFTTIPVESNVSFPSEGLEVNVDFCFQPGIEVDIIEVTLIPRGPARPGFDADYLITYKNTGNVTRGGDIKLTYQDELIDFVSSDPIVDEQGEGFLSWSFEDLIPYESRSIVFTMNLNSPMESPALVGGEYLDFVAVVGPLGNQTVSAYRSNLNQEVVNSFDPNDKTCLNGDVLDESMIGDYVKYMIRFENTGSAEAVNIVVSDTIDHTMFDIRTLEVLNSSHGVLAEVDGNTVDFIFKDIYLPFEDATNDGYVTFKIKTLETLELGDNLQNRAGIYFDFNFPIITNTTSTIVSDLSAVTDITIDELVVVLSPNPASEFVNIEALDNIKSLDIYTVSGVQVRHIDLSGNSPKHQLNIGGLSKGAYQIKIQSRDKVSLKPLVKI